MNATSFWLRLAGLVLVVAALLTYDQITKNRLVTESEETVQTVVESTTRAEPTTKKAASAGTPKDGTYEGTGRGFGGPIVVSVTIEDGEISDIEVVSHDFEDDAYFEMAEKLLPEMVEAQSTDVDTVSGSTFSSAGLQDAVKDALGKAVA